MPFSHVGLCFDLHCPITAGRLSWVLWSVAELTSVTDFTDSFWIWLIYDTITLRFSGFTSEISFSSVCPLTLLWHLEHLLFRKWMEVTKVCHLNCLNALWQNRRKTVYFYTVFDALFCYTWCENFMKQSKLFCKLSCLQCHCNHKRKNDVAVQITQYFI